MLSGMYLALFQMSPGFFLKCGGTISSRVSGHRRLGRGLEVSCVYSYTGTTTFITKQFLSFLPPPFSLFLRDFPSFFMASNLSFCLFGSTFTSRAAAPFEDFSAISTALSLKFTV